MKICRATSSNFKTNQNFKFLPKLFNLKIMAREGRPLFKIIFQNFINSFRLRQIKGDYKGEDHLGNKYYEILANASRGKSKRSRYFEPPGERSTSDPEDHGHELSAEWESWLRGRRFLLTFFLLDHFTKYL